MSSASDDVSATTTSVLQKGGNGGPNMRSILKRSNCEYQRKYASENENT